MEAGSISRAGCQPETAQSKCRWCSEPFTPRSDGGKPKRFCSERCRRAKDAALRAWAQDQFAKGRVTIAALQRARCSEGHYADG